MGPVKTMPASPPVQNWVFASVMPMFSVCTWLLRLPIVARRSQAVARQHEGARVRREADAGQRQAGDVVAVEQALRAGKNQLVAHHRRAAAPVGHGCRQPVGERAPPTQVRVAALAFGAVPASSAAVTAAHRGKARGKARGARRGEAVRMFTMEVLR